MGANSRLDAYSNKYGIQLQYLYLSMLMSKPFVYFCVTTNRC